MKEDSFNYRKFESFDDHSDDAEDNISEYREERQRKFDTRAAKRARAGGRQEARKKEKGFTRTSKEDRQSRY